MKSYVDSTGQYTRITTFIKDDGINNLELIESKLQTKIDEPSGPHPEQIRLLTYAAIGAGCKGVGFWSDKFLADSHGGRDRLLALALLNQELQLLEPILVETEEPTWVDTSLPDVKAAILRSDKGILVLPMWMGKGIPG